MKYNSNNAPLVCMQTNSTCYKGTTRLSQIKGVLWHSTGANNPNLKRYVQPSSDDSRYSELMSLLGKNTYNNDWNHITRYAGMNAWIGKLANGSVTTIQTMPWDFKPWGCGSGKRGSCNDGWLQFEICEDNLANADYFNKVYKEACELTAYLCEMFNLNPLGTTTHRGVTVPVILCHQDSYKLGLGGNHADVYHWFSKYGKDMDDVRKDVAALMNTKVESKPAATVPVDSLYRVRKSWQDAASQKGAFSSLQNAIACCNAAGPEYSVFDENGNKITTSQQQNKPSSGLQATALKGLSQQELVAKVGPLFTEDQKNTGVLASVSMAQFLLESAYAQSELAQNANNCFGMKKSLSDNTWTNSTWKGDIYKKTTKEFTNGQYVDIVAEFRKYDNVEDSIADHSAYLVGAKNGANLRYVGLKNELNYEKAAQIIKNGGYATSPTYVSSLCDVIRKWNLTQFDLKQVVVESPKAEEKEEVINTPKEEIKVETPKYVNGQVIKLKAGSTYTNGKAIPQYILNSTLYVRGAAGDDTIKFSTLKAGAITGITKISNIVEEKEIETSYTVKITANLLNVRSGPGINYGIKTTVKYNEIYTIIAEQNGWGKLKSGAGWINLKYSKKV